jgi:hypothetical protein
MGGKVDQTLDTAPTLPELRAAPLSATTEPRCISCGYDLRSLEPTGKCPECGLPIARSMQAGKHLCVEGGAMRRLRLGLIFLVLTGLGHAISHFMWFAYLRGIYALPQEFLRALIAMFQPAWLACELLLVLAAGFILSVPRAGRRRGQHVVWIAGLLLIIMGAGVLRSHFLPPFRGAWPSALAAVSLWLLEVVRSLILVLIWLHLLRLVRRRGEPVLWAFMFFALIGPGAQVFNALARSDFGSPLENVAWLRPYQDLDWHLDLWHRVPHAAWAVMLGAVWLFLRRLRALGPAIQGQHSGRAG